jgi:flavin-dependent dehydrogenase
LAVAELAALCPPDTLPAPLPLATVRLVSAGRSARIPMPGGGVLSREALDTALVQRAIAAGADWLPNLVVDAIHEQPSGGHAEPLAIVARSTNAKPEGSMRLHSRVAVIAAGLADTIRIVSSDHRGVADGSPVPPPPQPPRDRRVSAGSRVGVGTTLSVTAAASLSAAIDLPPGELMMAVARPGYCGIVRLEDGRLDLAAAVDRGLLAVAGGPAAGIGRLLRLADGDGRKRQPFADGLEALAAATFRATPPLTHHSPRTAGRSDQIFRVGDAASYVEPFTGEGIGWALASGRLLAESLLEGGGTSGRFAMGDRAAAAERYHLLHARLFSPQHARCRWVARGVRHPQLVSAAVQLAAALPAAAAWALPLATGALPRA